MIKQMTRKHSNLLLYVIALIVVCFVVYKLFSIQGDTSATVKNTENIVSEMQKSIDTLEANIKTDHARQDRYLKCVASLFIEKNTITQVDLDQCLITTAGVGTAPLGQATVPASPQLNSSPNNPFSQNTTPQPESQPDNSQTDNDGLITPEITVPIVEITIPSVHIGSPL